MALIDKLTNIADAIRGKTGGTEEMTLDAMAEAIAGIETGGGSSNEVETITMVEELSISDVFSATKYACKYKASLIQLVAFGNIPPTSGSYTVNLYTMIHIGSLVVLTVDKYQRGLVTPDSFLADSNVGTIEVRQASINETTGVVNVGSTSTKMGGVGTVIKLTEVPLAHMIETQGSNLWGE